jgi:uroporphyrinogen decarboxylase
MAKTRFIFWGRVSVTSLERVLKTLRFKEPDRVPYFEQGVASNVASAILGRTALTGGGGFRRMGVEAAMAGPDAYTEYVETFFQDWCDLVETLDFDVVSLPWAGAGAPTRKIDECTYLFGNLDAAWHVMRYNASSDTFHVVDAHTRRAGALEKIAAEVRAADARHAQRVKPTRASFPLLDRLIARFGHERAVADGPCLVIPMEPAWLEAMMVMPDIVECYTAMQADCACDAIDLMAEMGVRLIWGGGDFCTNKGPIYSPVQFRRFMLGPLKRMTACCHRHGTPYVFRTDGVIWPVAQELFVESGVDGYGEIDKQAGMDLAEVRRRLPHLILWGNVDCGHTLSSGTPAQVAEETRTCINAAAPGGGYILGSSNVIHCGVPAENFLAMIQTCRDYGRY